VCGLQATEDARGREQTIARMVSLLGAFSTTGAAVLWGMMHLGTRPAMLQRAREAALREREEREARTFLDAVCKEVLRFSPPFLGSLRRVAEPAVVDGIALHPGSTVLPCVYITHRREDIYPEPLRFRPERFLERSYSPYEYAPFGGGVRRCLGHALAIQQMRIILGEVLRTFDVLPERVWSHVDVRRNTLTLPRDRMPARLHALDRAVAPATHAHGVATKGAAGTVHA
jgi:cytochrome P450